jgi:hypothetical protein
MPNNFSVTLDYTAGHFGPTPATVKVKPNDTISFAIGAPTLADPVFAGSRLQITIHNNQGHFSPPAVRHDSPQHRTQPLQVTVNPGFAVKTGYKCELLHADGTPIQGVSSDVVLNPDGTPVPGGGEIEPDTTA